MLIMLDDSYFDNIFKTFQEVLKQEGIGLPSVSLVALEYNTPFAILVSTIISLRTKDVVTLAATKRIMALASNPAEMLKLSNEEIETAIYPCAFYKRKTIQLKQICQILTDDYNSLVPNDATSLLALPGVGIKTANLTLNLGFNIDAICVDSHVHKIANRLAWINTKTPEESVVELEKVMGKRFWIPLNELLVSYGQTICRPISPICSKCLENDNCPKVGVTKTR